jgi:hypothetical protein
MDEIWKDIPGYQHYQASSLGRLRSVERVIPHSVNPARTTRRCGRIIRLFETDRGYVLGRTCIDGRRETPAMHVLVLLAFAGPPPAPGMQVNHKNSIRNDNRPENLEWTTPQQNVMHSIRDGFRRQRGEHNQNAKLTHQQVDAIRGLLAEGRTGASIAKDFGVQHACISRIKRGVSWKI